MDLQTSWDWLHDASLVTMAGTDIRWRSMSSSHDKLNVDTGRSFLAANQSIPGLDTSDVTIGAYLQQTWTPVPTVHLNGGLRIDRDSRFSMVLVKRLSANWEAWKNGLLKLAYAEAFRAPSYDESNDSAADRISANAVNTQNGKDAVASAPGLNFGKPLKPETVKSVEASIQQKFGPHRILLGAFYSRWNDLVQLRQLSSDETRQAARNGVLAPLANGALMTQYQNADALDNYGLNLAIDGSVGFDALHYGLTTTVAQAKYRNTPTYIAPTNGIAEAERNGNIAPQIFGNARLAYIPGGVFPTIAVAAQFTGRRPPDQFLIMPDGTVLEPYAPTQVQTRLILSGVVPKIRLLSYRLMADYAFAEHGPYAVGPVMGVASSQTAQFGQTSPQLIPVSRFRVTLGLQVDF
jgi:outer membrane receptor protein involved in Fe transport